MRQLETTKYSSSEYSDEAMLMNFKMLPQQRLTKNLTHLWGKDSNMFPLLTYTEGNGALSVKKPKLFNGDTQYTWPVMGRMKHTSKVVRLNNSNITKPGYQRSQNLEVVMEDNWFINQHGVVSPDGLWQGRIQSEPTRTSDGYYLYTFANVSPDPENYCDLSNFTAGQYWLQTAPSIPASKSDGNRSNSMAPGEMTNQFGFQRFSKNIAGNISNKVVTFELDGIQDGKEVTSKGWMPFEMSLFEKDRRLMLEDELWYSIYNRDESGVIHLVDQESGEPIPKGAGVKQILTAAGNYDTYYNLTLNKVDSIMDVLYSNRVDDTPHEVVIYTGKGGRRMWHKAMQQDAIANNYFTALGENVIKGGSYLEYGNYFTQYKTIDDKLITIKESDLFNKGLRAEQDTNNGRLYNGLPYTSYEMVILDHSMDNNMERNIQLVAEEGREMNVGVYKGMSPLPAAWGSFNNIISDKKDIASYEVITSQGINITNPTTSLWLHFEGE